MRFLEVTKWQPVYKMQIVQCLQNLWWVTQFKRFIKSPYNGVSEAQLQWPVQWGADIQCWRPRGKAVSLGPGSTGTCWAQLQEHSCRCLAAGLGKGSWHDILLRASHPASTLSSLSFLGNNFFKTLKRGRYLTYPEKEKEILQLYVFIFTSQNLLMLGNDKEKSSFIHF